MKTSYSKATDQIEIPQKTRYVKHPGKPREERGFNPEAGWVADGPTVKTSRRRLPAKRLVHS